MEDLDVQTVITNVHRETTLPCSRDVFVNKLTVCMYVSNTLLLLLDIGQL